MIGPLCPERQVLRLRVLRIPIPKGRETAMVTYVAAVGAVLNLLALAALLRSLLLVTQ